MKKTAAAACIAALLGSSVAFAQSSPKSNTTMVTTDPVTGEKSTRPATDAERARARAAMERIRPGLAGLEGLKGLDGLKGLKGLEALKALDGLKALEGLKALDGLEAEIARMQRMVDTELPVSTTTTSAGTVRVYRDGTTVTDSGGSRSFQKPDHP